MTRSFHWNVAAVQETTFANNDAKLSLEQAKNHPNLLVKEIPPL